jgi:hypothetical protein
LAVALDLETAAGDPGWVVHRGVLWVKDDRLAVFVCEV